MTDYDVLVVGGGPAGAVAARSAAAAGARVLLLEQEETTAERVRCTGLVSPRTLAQLGVPSTCVLREIRGGLLHAPGGKTVEIRAERPKALVLDRAKLHHELIDLASSAGVEVRAGTRAVAATRGAVRLEKNGRLTEVKVHIVIGADGPRSDVGRWFSLPEPEEFLGASQAVIAGRPRKDDEVEIFLGREVAPGFFGWSVPAEEGRLRVGLAAAPGTDTDALLDRLLERTPGEVLARGGGLIPIGPAPETAGDGVLLVGDAAGQAKPTSGGGIYTGSLCAKIAGEIAAFASLAERTTRETLAEYDRRWRGEIGEELRFGLAAHRALFSLSDREIDTGFAILNDPAILHLIAAEGDIDYPSRLGRAFLRRQDLWPRLLPLLRAASPWKNAEAWLGLLFAPHERGPL
jgi:geranylgeranyl reductase family protein